MINLIDTENTHTTTSVSPASGSAAVREIAQTQAESSTAALPDEIQLQFHTDRVEISDQGRAFADASISQQVPAASTPQDAASLTQPSQDAESAQDKQALAGAKSAISQLSENKTADAGNDASSDSSSSVVLTTLTEQQISDLVSSGAITRAQADSELARRTASQQEPVQSAAAQSVAVAQMLAE